MLRRGASANRTIYVRVVVDTDGLPQDRPASGTDAPTPTTVSFDGRQMIVTTTAGAVDPDTGAITVVAAAGDLIRFYAKSGSNNFESAILIDDIGLGGDEQIVDGLALVSLPGMAIAPGVLSGEKPEKQHRQKFWFWQCAVAGDGTRDFSLDLALYGRDDNGQPDLAGLYRWDLQFTVQCSPRPEGNAAGQESTP